MKYIAYSVFRCMWLFFCWNYASRLNCIVNIRTQGHIKSLMSWKVSSSSFYGPKAGLRDIFNKHLSSFAYFLLTNNYLPSFDILWIFWPSLDSHMTLIWPFFSPQMLTLFYLDNLVSCLRDIGYNHLTLPILAFEDLLSRDLLKSEPLNVLVHFK